MRNRRTGWIAVRRRRNSRRNRRLADGSVHTALASALARNDPTLLAKSDPPPQPGGRLLPQGKRIFAAQQALWSWPPQPGGGSVVPPAKRCNLRVLRAFGADAGKSPRTPSAWMKLLGRFLAHRQDVFFVWVSLSEQKWVTLGERRGGVGALRSSRRTLRQP
jgi:hypothetical protein